MPLDLSRRAVERLEEARDKIVAATRLGRERSSSDPGHADDRRRKTGRRKRANGGRKTGDGRRRSVRRRLHRGVTGAAAGAPKAEQTWVSEGRPFTIRRANRPAGPKKKRF